LGVDALDSIGSGINAIHSIDGTLSVRRAVPYHLARAWFAGEHAADDLDKLFEVNVRGVLNGT